MSAKSDLPSLAKLVRYHILKMTTEAGSGHTTSSLSATDLMTALFFGKLRFDLKNPENLQNDRVIFSKGHVSPLVYALYAASGEISEEELLTYRKFGSELEGHPTARFKFAEAATGSLGQGLSIGAGMALAMKSQGSKESKSQDLPMAYVLMGDSEVAEGSVWEAAELASYYKLGNLVAILDVNRLGQSGETMLGWNTDTYKARFEAFGWEARVIDGHDLGEITATLEGLSGGGNKPTIIIAKTIKGKGVSFLEDKEGWHGKALSQEEFEKAAKELGEVDKSVKGSTGQPAWELKAESGKDAKTIKLSYKVGEEVATRKAFGETLAMLGEDNERIVSLDAEVKNSTFAEIFKDKFPERFFECFVAEQNMVGMAIGMAKLGKVPFVSTFAAFFTRAFDQIRMGAYGGANVKFVGSHSGVSIGEDGPSQMGLEDLAMFKSVFGSTVFCPSDAVSCARLLEIAAETRGIFYVRTARPATPVIYKESEEFTLGGSKVLKSSNEDKLTIAACGLAVTEAMKAADTLGGENINVRVVDLYSVKPIDEAGLRDAAKNSNNIILSVEDHYFEGGLGDSILNVFAGSETEVIKLAALKMPMSGGSSELLDYEGISSLEIVKKVKEVIDRKQAPGLAERVS